MPKLYITTSTGEKQTVEAKIGCSMMEALNSVSLVEGTCGGAASYGTCHVYFKDSAAAGEQTEDEGYMLEGLADFVEVKESSRLSCQIILSDVHDGAEIEIAPEA